MSESVETASSEAAPKKKSKLILIIAVVVVVALGGGGYFFLRPAAGKDDPAKAEKGKEKKKAHAEEDEEEEEDSHDATPKSGEKGKSSSSSSKESLKSALPEDEEVKQIVELQPFVVNLADTEEARYLRLTVSVGVGGGEGGHDKPDPLFITRVRNAMLAVVTGKKSEEILTVEGKSKLRKELLKAAKAASHHPVVEAIYITDFIVQL